MKVLVTGGAGYIGSHVVKALGAAGHDVLTYDNLSAGRQEAVLCGDLVIADLADRAALADALDTFKPGAVMHFAGSIEVAESVRDPLKYYRNNTVNTLGLLAAMREAGVGLFIFSSTAAVYGTPETVPIPESHPMHPINPYGHSKAAVERVLADMAGAYGLRYVSLRYFNAAGAASDGTLGENHNPETHLIPLLLRNAAGVMAKFTMYGTDYPTPDGTCVRDFVHVEDLADAHLLAMDYLLRGGESVALNCGYGHGHSVREVAVAARRVTGRELSIEESGRRPGDPAVLVADGSAIRRVLGWRPVRDDLDAIVASAWRWQTGGASSARS